MPWTAAAAHLAALSMSGFPVSFGFLAKVLTNIAKKEGEVYTWAAHASVMVSALTVAVSAIAAIRVFWHRGGETLSPDIREVGWAMRWPPVLIAGVGILFGTQPQLMGRAVGAAAEAMHPHHDFARPFSVVGTGSGWTALGVALLLGTGVFVAWDRIHRALAPFQLGPLFRASDWYEQLLKLISTLARLVTRVLQGGALSAYVTLLVSFMALGLGGSVWLLLRQRGLDLPLYLGGDAASGFATGSASLGVVCASLLVVIAAAAACFVRDTFVMLLCSGLVGLSCALIFLFLGAPDLAFTQFTVEVAFVVVIASILLRVRRLDLATPPTRTLGPRATLALVMGTLVTLLTVLAVDAGPPDPALKQFFSERSLAVAHGRNVVNVVLVDFRAVDTLGEIIVVLVSFMAAAPLLARLRQNRETT